MLWEVLCFKGKPPSESESSSLARPPTPFVNCHPSRAHMPPWHGLSALDWLLVVVLMVVSGEKKDLPALFTSHGSCSFSALGCCFATWGFNHFVWPQETFSIFMLFWPICWSTFVAFRRLSLRPSEALNNALFLYVAVWKGFIMTWGRAQNEWKAGYPTVFV